MIVGVMFGASSGVAAGQTEDERARFQAWPDGTINIDREVLRSGSTAYKVEYDIEFLYTLSEAEFAAIRKRVEGKPEHPDRALLALEPRRTRPDVDQFVLWLKGDEFRRSVTRVSGGDSALDDVQTGALAWRMTPEALTLARRGDQITRSGIARFVDSNLDDALVLFTGGLHRAVWSGAPVHGILAADGTWRAEADKAINDGQWRLRATGRWDAAADSGEVWRVELSTTRADGTVSGLVIATSGWSMAPGFPRPVARESLTKRQNGVPDRRVVFRSIATIDDHEFRRVTRVPPLAGSDEHRGPVTFREVYDHTEGEIRVVGAEGEEDIMRRPLPESAAVMEVDKRERLRIAGWVLGGLVLTCLVWFRLRIRRRHS